MQALELLLDRATDEAVRRDWESLRRAGLPSQANHRGETNAPHITLLATELLPAADDELRSALSVLLPLHLALGPVVTFPGRRLVLARLVTADIALLDLHSAAVTASGAAPSPLTERGRWVPHVTLARGLRPEDMGTALSLLGSGTTGTAVTLRRWDSEARQVHQLVG